MKITMKMKTVLIRKNLREAGETGEGRGEVGAGVEVVGPGVGHGVGPGDPGVEPKLGPEEEGGKVESKMICYFED